MSTDDDGTHLAPLAHRSTSGATAAPIGGRLARMRLSTHDRVVSMNTMQGTLRSWLQDTHSAPTSGTATPAPSVRSSPAIGFSATSPDLFETLTDARRAPLRSRGEQERAERSESRASRGRERRRRRRAAAAAEKRRAVADARAARAAALAARAAAVHGVGADGGWVLPPPAKVMEAAAARAQWDAWEETASGDGDGAASVSSELASVSDDDESFCSSYSYSGLSADGDEGTGDAADASDGAASGAAKSDDVSLQFSSEVDEGGVLHISGGVGHTFVDGGANDGDGGLDRMYELIETARVSDQHALHVPIIGLTRVPARIGRLDKVEELYIKSNLITTLPGSIGALASLRILELQQNHLLTLPPELGELKALTSLDVSWNKIELLPPSLGKCSRLRVLVLSHNKLVSLPQEIGFLLGLEVLLADDNELTSLPPSFGYLQHLRQFSVSENRLRSLIPQIGLLTQCESYDISRNPMVASLSLPLWFLGEPIAQRVAWCIDGALLAIFVALMVAGGVMGSTPPRSTHAAVLLALTATLLSLLFVSVGAASARVDMPSFTPSPRIRRTTTNALALFTLLWEFIQLVAMCIPGVRWPGAVGTSVRVALLDSSVFFAPLFWVSVVLGAALRIALEFPRLQSALKSVGLSLTLNLSSYLAFASALFYLPILHNALGALACSYDTVEPDAPGTLVAHRNAGLECWHGAHFAYATAAFAALLVYYPMAVLSNPVWQERNMSLDVRFHPTFLLLVGQAKMFFSLTTNFVHDPVTRLSILLASFLALAAYTLYRRPSSSSLDVWRAAAFIGASAVASAGIWVSTVSGIRMALIIGLVVAFWAALALLAAADTAWRWHVKRAALR